MRIKLVLGILVSILLLPLQANALGATNSTDSADLMQKREKIKENIQEAKESFRERKMESHEAMQAKKDEFKLRLQALRDQKKKMIVERMDTRMANANKKATTRFSAVLEKIQDILNKIIEKAGLIKAKGVDTAALDTATASAQLSINNASGIVASQSAMVYVMHIASESALKENVGSTVSELRLDLRDAHKAVIDAKQAVYKAAMELTKLKHASNSAQ